MLYSLYKNQIFTSSNISPFYKTNTFQSGIIFACRSTGFFRRRHVPKKILILSISLLSLTFAQEKKPDFALDEELGTFEKELPKKNNLEDEQINIEGDDEQLFKHKKGETFTVDPDTRRTLDWDSLPDQIPGKERKKINKVQRQAQMLIEYGSYHSLNADIFVSKKDDIGTYLLEYNRRKYDSEGYGVTTVPNSEYSSDDISFTSGFTINENYKTLVKAAYQDRLRGLQENSSFRKQFKRGGFLEWQNQLRPNESQKLLLSLNADYITSDLESRTLSSNDSLFARLKASADWNLIFGDRNSINLGGNLWYGENKTYQPDEKNYYRVGEFYAKNIFPIYKNIAEDSQSSWQVDLILGMQIFFAQGAQPVFGPIATLDSFWGNWHSSLQFEGRGEIPDMRNSFLQNSFHLPVHYFAAQEKYEASWKNSIKISPGLTIKANIGYRHYSVFYNSNYLLATEMYRQTGQLFRASYTEAGLEHVLLNWLAYESGTMYEVQHDTVALRPIVTAFLRLNITPGDWKILPEIRLTGSRNSGPVNLPSFVLLNTTLEFQANQTLSIFVRGHNLLNTRYQDFFNYNTSGLRAFFGVNLLI